MASGRYLLHGYLDPEGSSLATNGCDMRQVYGYQLKEFERHDAVLGTLQISK